LLSRWDGAGPSVFLAGGISNCADWQSTLAEKFAITCPNLVLLNPRRKNFDVSDHSESERQIKWEFNHLRKSSAILFWFPSETLCPITLFELGQWSALAGLLGKRLFVGCDPQYQRKVCSHRLFSYLLDVLTEHHLDGRRDSDVFDRPSCTRSPINGCAGRFSLYLVFRALTERYGSKMRHSVKPCSPVNVHQTDPVCKRTPISNINCITWCLQE
jgi:hypothetical protein